MTASKPSRKVVAHRPDLLLLDVMMPRMDGLEVCRRLRSAGDDLPILVLTARDSVSERVAGLDAGADDYLAKPFALEELLARLRALLRRATPRTRIPRPWNSRTCGWIRSPATSPAVKAGDQPDAHRSSPCWRC